MKAAVIRGKRLLAYEELPMPKVEPGALLLKMKYCSICGSDLEAYQEQLKQECEAFANTRSTKMTEVDREIEAIDDPLLKRQMQRRREQAYRETGAALSAARATVAELAAVLKQASNIQHVANCIRLSEELAANSQDLRVQIQQIRTFASDYSQRTATLLATLSQAGVEPAAPAVAD